MLNRAFNAALKDTELHIALMKMGLEPRGTTPDEFASFIREEIKRWPQRAGITPQ